MSSGFNVLPVGPPMVPRIPEIDFISVIFYISLKPRQRVCSRGVFVVFFVVTLLFGKLCRMHMQAPLCLQTLCPCADGTIKRTCANWSVALVMRPSFM